MQASFTNWASLERHVQASQSSSIRRTCGRRQGEDVREFLLSVERPERAPIRDLGPGEPWLPYPPALQVTHLKPTSLVFRNGPIASRFP